MRAQMNQAKLHGVLHLSYDKVIGSSFLLSPPFEIRYSTVLK
ncbi:hypothetical protein PI124_g7283 [Phytophthora idaei]|nr:hypothetical protein PI126_g6629 [Phytophthora idaei]KAG3248025.1 hypothetical protein PI124_g7283 [Phytophthora idaei]